MVRLTSFAALELVASTRSVLRLFLECVLSEEAEDALVVKHSIPSSSYPSTK